MDVTKAVLELEALFSTSQSSIVDYQLIEQHIGFDIRDQPHLMKTVKRRLFKYHEVAISAVRGQGYYVHKR
jgi:hypothetical protein